MILIFFIIFLAQFPDLWLHSPKLCMTKIWCNKWVQNTAIESWVYEVAETAENGIGQRHRCLINQECDRDGARVLEGNLIICLCWRRQRQLHISRKSATTAAETPALHSRRGRVLELRIVAVSSGWMRVRQSTSVVPGIAYYGSGLIGTVLGTWSLQDQRRQVHM